MSPCERNVITLSQQIETRRKRKDSIIYDKDD